MYRHNPQTAKLVELVRDGAIGELRVIRSAFSYGLYDADNIRLRTDVEGGALMDVGCYNVSGSRLLGGEPERVWGEAWYGPSGTDWVFSGHAALSRQRDRHLRLRHGARRSATSWRRSAARARSSSTIRGTATVPIIELRREDEVELIELEPVDSYQLELENLSDAIRGEARPAARARGRARPGSCARGAPPVRDDRRGGLALEMLL